MAASVLAWAMGRMELPFIGMRKVEGGTGRCASIGRSDWNKVKRGGGRRCGGGRWMLGLELRGESRLATAVRGTRREAFSKVRQGERQMERDRGLGTEPGAPNLER